VGVSNRCIAIINEWKDELPMLDKVRRYLELNKRVDVLRAGVALASPRCSQGYLQICFRR